MPSSACKKITGERLLYPPSLRVVLVRPYRPVRKMSFNAAVLAVVDVARRLPRQLPRRRYPVTVRVVLIRIEVVPLYPVRIVVIEHRPARIRYPVPSLVILERLDRPERPIRAQVHGERQPVQNVVDVYMRPAQIVFAEPVARVIVYVGRIGDHVASQGMVNRRRLSRRVITVARLDAVRVAQ